MNLPPITPTQKCGIAFGIFVCALALWSLTGSIFHAATVGTVTLEDDDVPWPNAWAYFVGLFCLVGAGASSIAAALVDSRLVSVVLLLLFLGWLLFTLSPLLSSLLGAAMVFGMTAVLVVTYYVDKYLGKLEASVFFALVILGFFVLLFSGRLPHGA